MKNLWNYANLGQVKYGHPESYERPCAWFDRIGGVLEDWGCGCAAAKAYVKKCQYIGIDGSQNEFADRCDVDLREYTSKPDCLLLRDVLDHNVDWEKVLQNALESFQKRMVIVVFRALGPETKVVFTNTDPKYPGVPDLQFNRNDLLKHIAPFLVKEEQVENETIFYLAKKTSAKYVVFSLFGDDPKYLVGAWENLVLRNEWYPDWNSVYYVDSAETDTAKRLKESGAIIMDCSGVTLGGFYWRHGFPWDFPDAKAYIVRDCDSRIGAREVAAVQEWLESDKTYHMMRDHPYHTLPLMQGMYGAKGNGLKPLKNWLMPCKNVRCGANEVLAKAYYEIMRPSIMEHGEFHSLWYENQRPFPTPRTDGRFVGEIFDQDNQPNDDWKMIAAP